MEHTQNLDQDGLRNYAKKRSVTQHRLKKIEDIDSNISWATKPMTDSDWPVVFIVRCQYCDYWDSEWAKKGKYHFSINAVSPEAAKDNIDEAIKSLSMAREDFDKLPIEYQCQVLLDYGTAATLWQSQGNNKAALLKAARHELNIMHMLFGFYMDKAQNAIGSTGWDWISGDILRPVREYKKPEVVDTMPNATSTERLQACVDSANTAIEIIKKMEGK